MINVYIVRVFRSCKFYYIINYTNYIKSDIHIFVIDYFLYKYIALMISKKNMVIYDDINLHYIFIYSSKYA